MADLNLYFLIKESTVDHGFPRSNCHKFIEFYLFHTDLFCDSKNDDISVRIFDILDNLDSKRRRLDLLPTVLLPAANTMLDMGQCSNKIHIFFQMIEN